MKNLNSLKGALAIALLVLGSACTSTNIQPAAPVVEENLALKAALSQQADDNQARYLSRNPEATLNFFGIQPGMTVVEALPGGGWYSKILIPYLGENGELVGVDYSQKLWPNFSFMTPERIEAKKTWVSTWTAQAKQWRDDNGASITAFQFDEMPSSMAGSADAMLFIRALHNLARFEDNGNFLSNSLKETYTILKPGGIVGVVQHQAREDRPDDWSNGDNGYLKKSFIVAKMQAAGFEFVGQSDINENAKDQANVGDIVWRLPPSLSGSKDDDEKRAAMLAVGESNRMTLKFRKPL
ncbi:MAG: class I SAM-dependent methyltransferase [Arenicella sp.]|nr:class I SAM-dependent methyltransferase [Arenicella sp.]